MRRVIACASTAIVVVTCAMNCPLATAQTVVIPHTARGWYDSTGFHNAGNPNYAAGDTSLNVIRNFFVFDLTSVAHPITAAKLALYVPSAAAGPGYASADPSENYELHDVSTSLASLTAAAAGQVATYNDLGSGTVYGSRTMTAADQGFVVEINLSSAAVAALDAATGQIAIGGLVTTLDGVSNFESVFSTSGSAGDISELRLTVPEPSAFVLSAVVVAFRLGLRSRKAA